MHTSPVHLSVCRQPWLFSSMSSTGSTVSSQAYVDDDDLVDVVVGGGDDGIMAETPQEYHDVNRTYNDVAQALSQYPSLSPRTDVHSKNLLYPSSRYVLSCVGRVWPANACHASSQHFRMAALPCSSTSPAPSPWCFEERRTASPYRYGSLTHTPANLPSST